MTGIGARDMELSSVTYTSHEPIAEAVTYKDGARGAGGGERVPGSYRAARHATLETAVLREGSLGSAWYQVDS